MAEAPDLRSVSRPTASGASARRRRAAIQRVLPISVLALGVLGMPILLISSGGLSRLDQLDREEETVELEISRVTKRIEQLRARARAQKTDPAAVERSARDQLGLVRRTEVVFQFTEQRPDRH